MSRVHARLLQSCPALCDAMDYSPPDSSVHGILQARILQWIAMCSSGDIPDPGIELVSLMTPALAGRYCTTSATWEACINPVITVLQSKRIWNQVQLLRRTSQMRHEASQMASEVPLFSLGVLDSPSLSCLCLSDQQFWKALTFRVWSTKATDHLKLYCPWQLAQCWHISLLFGWIKAGATWAGR